MSFAVSTRRAVLALLALPATAYAQAKPHVIDPSHSEINFVADARLLSAHGFFGKWEAQVMMNPTAPESTTVAITIDAASINTRVERRDNHLRSKDFFDVANYPTITFVSKIINKVGPTRFNVTGDLTMRGVTKTVTAPATLMFYENGRGRVKGEFTVNRRDFGMGFSPQGNLIADEVQVQFDIGLIDREAAEKARAARAAASAPPAGARPR